MPTNTDTNQGARFVFHTGDTFQPDTPTHDDLEGLVSNAARITGATPDNPTSIRGHGSRRGTYGRLAPNGGPSASARDPILDSLTTTAGELVVGGQGHPVTASITLAGLTTLVQAARATMCCPDRPTSEHAGRPTAASWCTNPART